MYDGGNKLTIKVGSLTAADLSYTNTEAYTSAGIGDVQYYTYKHEVGQLYAFVAEFTSASSAITGFQITGNNGADGGGSSYYGKYDSSSWTGLQNGWQAAFKKVYAAGDPSINHLVMAQGPINSQSVGATTDDDLHDLAFSSGVSKVVYVLWAGNSGYEFSDSFFQSVAEALSSACLNLNNLCLPTAESGTYACISETAMGTMSAAPALPSCEACTQKGLVYAWTHARTSLWTAAMVQTLYARAGKTCTLPTGNGPWSQGPSCSSAG